MKEQRIKKDEELQAHHYRAWYRCTNCGTIFQHDMPMRTLAASMDGVCPCCNVKSNTPQVGVFPIIKYNPDHDKNERFYYK